MKGIKEQGQAPNNVNLSPEEDEQEQKQIKEDLEQMSNIYFNLYLSAVTNDQRVKAMEYNLKHMEL
jgi:hypothetical protein